MRLPVDAEFLHEVERFALRFTCGNCMHLVVSAGSVGSAGVCGNGWPTEDHMLVPVSGERVVFCKEFEVA
jgi:hypothetical protein